ncbi:MAG: TetM/TetW/TetO/TetS family tetracycline resistance ribosomal protection protein [Bacillota bacterium]|nr:TetM/TetW/TetO/TetS family tetracycline resistance ribosomal protection protein [Bacillota bacterium]
MGKTIENKPTKRICAGLLAHVDAGKTTLSEGLLYKAGAIKTQGRVDHQNAFLDTDAQEKARGITIFSKQAELTWGDLRIMLLDTPGHVDFSAEMERTLQVLDYAILVIGGKDGVQGHTLTLWNLLERHEIPVFIFVNKMDLEGADRDGILEELRLRLDSRCVDFSGALSHGKEHVWLEQIAMCDESLLEEFLEKNTLADASITGGISKRHIFPCYFGSALKVEGIEGLLDGITRFSREPQYAEEFGARVYKITRDPQGNRLTHMKVTGGRLRVKDVLETGGGTASISAEAQHATSTSQAVNSSHGEAADSLHSEKLREKAEQIRIYSGAKFRTVDEAAAGDICAVTGLKHTFAGQGLGAEQQATEPVLESVLSYQVILPPQQDVHEALQKLRQLEEEDPQLHIIWNEQLQEIQLQLMGEVQLEILKTIGKERFNMDLDFGQGNITYRETIAGAVTGAGHFEPLRHYAEVHLLLEPAEQGSGLTFDSDCSEDVLDRNWQRLILTHLAEKEHVGVLTGSPITDVKITLLTGKAHLKHTEGGDFRQATYRALRQGLRKAESILLEPWYEFRLEVPGENIGRAMSDVQKMGGAINEPEPSGTYTTLTGKAPVSEMKDYGLAVASYTKGLGRLSLSLSGYEPCHDQQQVVEEIGYDPDRDLENTADSVFCQHGAGFTVKWDQVEDYLHLQSGWPPASLTEKTEGSAVSDAEAAGSGAPGSSYAYYGTKEEDEELERIFERTYGKRKPHRRIPPKTITPKKEQQKTKPAEILEEYLLVDGYNIIFAWEQLKELSKINMDSAREALIEILANYQGYRRCRIIVVFDAYKVKGGERRYEKHENVDVVYTQEAETADMYIERTAYEKKGKYHIRVATSDRLEQMIILGNDAFKVSADEFKLEIQQAEAEITAFIEKHNMRNRQRHRNGIKIPGEK